MLTVDCTPPSSFSHVRQLDLSGCNGLRLKGADLRHLSLLRELRMPSSATDDDLGAAAPSLRETLVLLDLSLCRRVTDEGIKETLGHLTGLTELDLAGCSAVTGDSLCCVSQLPRLTALGLSSCPASAFPDALALLPAGKLQRLLLDDNPWVGDEAVEALASTQPNLTALSLQLCPQVTDQGATKLASLSGLLSLSLSGCPVITDTTAAALGRLTSLEELSLAWCTKLTNIAATYLSSLKRLESLSLGGCESMTDSAARELGRNHPALTSLCLEDASLTDACCLDLGRAKALRRLDLNGCRALTAACLPVLVGSLPSLISLDMRGTRVAPEAAEALRESHPQLCLAVCFTDQPP